MKFATVLRSMALGFALLLASGAFAATKANLQLFNSVTVNGTSLKPGDYKVQWDGTGNNVELSIMRGNKVLAKVPAHIIQLDRPSGDDAALTRKNDAGTSTLAGIRFQGKRFALELGENAEGMQAGSSK